MPPQAQDVQPLSAEEIAMAKCDSSDERTFSPDLFALRALATIEGLQAERDTYRTLARIGTWHHDCRPNRLQAARELDKSQATIDKLADTITTLNQQLDTQAQELARLRALRSTNDDGTTDTAEAVRELQEVRQELARVKAELTPHIEHLAFMLETRDLDAGGLDSDGVCPECDGVPDFGEGNGGHADHGFCVNRELAIALKAAKALREGK